MLSATFCSGSINPSGRLPVTFPRAVSQVPEFTDYSMHGRTYRYLTEDPLYPFGFGLSYTRFAYGAIKLSSPTIRRGRQVTVSLTVSNVGSRPGDEVVQAYLTNHNDHGGPACNLIGIQRLRLEPGQSREIQFRIAAEAMRRVDESGRWVLEPARFTLRVGGCSPGSRGVELGAAGVSTADFEVR